MCAVETCVDSLLVCKVYEIHPFWPVERSQLMPAEKTYSVCIQMREDPEVRLRVAERLGWKASQGMSRVGGAEAESKPLGELQCAKDARIREEADKAVQALKAKLKNCMLRHSTV
jgi:predicted DNA-binding protein (UPF0278 family)